MNFGRLRGRIFSGLVLAAFALMAPASASPGVMTGAGNSFVVRADNASPILLAQQNNKKASPNPTGKTTTKSDDLYRPRCGAYARTNKCNARWDIRSGSCVC